MSVLPAFHSFWMQAGRFFVRSGADAKYTRRVRGDMSLISKLSRTIYTIFMIFHMMIGICLSLTEGDP